MKKRPTFADIVSEVESAPPAAKPVRNVAGQALVAPDGVVYEFGGETLTDEEANELLVNGARAAIDDCGCMGYCTVQWLGDDAVVTVPPVKKAKKRGTMASVLKWRGDDGSILVMFSGPDFKWPS